MRVHAIYAVLNDLHLFRASIASIYEYVSGITVITGYDRDWKGNPYPVEGIVDAVLSREVDPERKVGLVIAWDPNEARARNRAMDFADPPQRSRRVLMQHPADREPSPPDYFWIIDADEIYESVHIDRLLAYVDRGRRRYYQVPGVQYFKYWNYRVEGYEWFTAFVRADQRVGTIRNPFPTHISRVLHRARAPGLANRLLGLEKIPPDVGFFHHGTYVGPRSRIEAKTRYSGHSHLMQTGWLENVWDRWHPEMRDLHPVDPPTMPATVAVPLSRLPAEITSHSWPDGYLEAPQSFP